MPPTVIHYLTLISITPSIIYSSKSQSITENQTLTLYCNATGNPVPTIQWSNVGSSSNVFAKGNSLKISAIKESDKGTYKCTAYNGILRPAEAVVSINVLGKKTKKAKRKLSIFVRALHDTVKTLFLLKNYGILFLILLCVRRHALLCPSRGFLNVSSSCSDHYQVC